MPKVSVIIPIYGVEQYIERCAVSLLEQTLDDIEYLFINDCTNDNSIEILKQVISRYPLRLSQIRIVDMPKNSGQAAVRKYGIELATGDFIIHCDSDDWIDVNMYKDMYDTAVSTMSDIVVCNYKIVNGKEVSITVEQTISNKKINIISDLLVGNIEGYVWNKLVKSNLYKSLPYFPCDNLTEDLTMAIQLFYNSNSWSHLAKDYYHYYQNEESITNKRIDDTHILKKGEQVYRNFLLIEKFLKEQPDYSEYIKHLTIRKYRVKLGLRNMCIYPGGVKIWRTIFPELKLWSIFRYKLSLRTKIGYIITHLGLYSIIARFLK